MSMLVRLRDAVTGLGMFWKGTQGAAHSYASGTAYIQRNGAQAIAAVALTTTAGNAAVFTAAGPVSLRVDALSWLKVNGTAVQGESTQLAAGEAIVEQFAAGDVLSAKADTGTATLWIAPVGL